MTREEKENLLREAVDILIKLDNHLMTSRDNAEFSSWVEDLIDNSCCEEWKENEVDEGYLMDWYISSVTDDPPVWTEEHISELIGDFHLIPRIEADKES